MTKLGYKLHYSHNVKQISGMGMCSSRQNGYKYSFIGKKQSSWSCAVFEMNRNGKFMTKFFSKTTM